MGTTGDAADFLQGPDPGPLHNDFVAPDDPGITYGPSHPFAAPEQPQPRGETLMPSDFPELGGVEMPRPPHEEPIPVGPIVTGPGAPTSTHVDGPPEDWSALDGC